VGSVDSIVEQLHHWRDAFGVSYFVFPAMQLDAAAAVVARVAGS
jgi:hypothetical protein